MELGRLFEAFLVSCGRQLLLSTSLLERLLHLVNVGALHFHSHASQSILDFYFNVFFDPLVVQ